MSLITIKESKRYPGLFVHKYKKEVFYKKLWHTDPTLLESRGHVYNSSGKLVVAGFSKIFNRGENGTDIPRDHKCLVVEKINGFMAAVTYVPDVDDVVISTTGSLDSDFVYMAKELISEKFIDDLYTEASQRAMDCKVKGHEFENYTFLFEIVHKNDPHIIQHDEGAYLIGRREVSLDDHYWSHKQLETDLDNIADEYGFYRPMWYIDRFSNIINTTRLVKHEGFVVYDQDGENCASLKIKSPYYLAMKAMARCKDIFTLDKRRVDEEYYPLLDHIKNNVEPSYWESLDEQAKLEFIREWVTQ